MLRAEAVSKTYTSPAGDVTALSAFSHTFTPGKITVIKGPSGSGKSTLLNVLAGLDVPSSGSVWVNDTDLTRLPEAKRAELRLTTIGFVFQSFNLIAVLNARENVAFPLGLAGVSREERTEKAEDLLTRFGLGHRLTHLPYKLSGGEKQRVALARALANDPDIVLCRRAHRKLRLPKRRRRTGCPAHRRRRGAHRHRRHPRPRHRQASRRHHRPKRRAASQRVVTVGGRQKRHTEVWNREKEKEKRETLSPNLSSILRFLIFDCF